MKRLNTWILLTAPAAFERTVSFYLVALSVGVVIQLIKGWDWADFSGRSITTLVIVSLVLSSWQLTSRSAAASADVEG